MQNTNNIVTSTRYNNNLQRNVYYAKSDTCCDYDVLLCEILHVFKVKEWAMKVYNSSTHKFAVKVIDTNTGNMLDSNYDF